MFLKRVEFIAVLVGCARITLRILVCYVLQELLWESGNPFELVEWG